MKKFFITIVALGTLISCSKDEVVNMSKMPIAFGGTFVDDTTRALDDPSYGEGKLIDQFTAWGIVTGNVGSSNLYGGDGTVVSRDGVAYGLPFTSNEQEWWIPSAMYQFAAVANHKSVTLENGLPSSITYTCTAENKDLIYAEPVTVTTSDSAEPEQSTGTPNEGVNENGCVPFVFSHLLSKVYFTFVSTSQPLEVTKVQATGHYAEGTYTISTQQWSSTTLASEALSFGDADSQVTTKGTISQKACLIIPGQQTWNISLMQGDDAKSATLTDFVFEPNKAYNILVTLEGASAITFEIEKLEAWGDVKNVELYF